MKMTNFVNLFIAFALISNTVWIGSVLAVDDNFESYSNGQYPSSGGWYNLFSGKTAAVSTTHSYSGSKSFRLEGYPTWSRVDVINVATYSQTTYEAAVYIPNSSRGAILGYWVAQGSQAPSYNGVNFQNDGKIYTRGIGGTDVFIQSYQANRWYLVKVVIDFSTNTMDFYVDGTRKLSNLPAKDASYCTKFGLGTNNFSGSGTAEAYIDDVKYTDTTPLLPVIRLAGNLSFGNVQVGASSQKTLTIYNDGNATLSVSNITYPSGFSGNWSGNISAGGSHAVTVTFAPTQVKSYSGTVTVNSNATSGTNTASISGAGTVPANSCLYVVANPDNKIVSILNSFGLSVIASTTIPSNLSMYKLVICADYSASNPSTAPYVASYVSGGGATLLIGGTPSTFSGGGYNISSISTWFGASLYSNVNTSDAVVDFNNPFGTSLMSGDVIEHVTGYGAAAVTSVSSSSIVLSKWQYGSNNVHSFIHPYSGGRVGFWAASSSYNSNTTLLIRNVLHWLVYGSPTPVPSTRTIRLAGNLSFGNVQVGASSQKTLTIYNDGNATLSVSNITYPSGFSGNWSGNISAGGSHAVTVTFAPTQVKSYSGTVTVNSNATSGANTAVISGAGTAVPSPFISRSPTSLSPTCTVGANAASQTFNVWNSGGGTLSYTVSDNQSWLYCSPTSGNSTGEHDAITVHYNTSGLSAGSYSATITISSSNAGNSPRTILVNLTVQTPPQTANLSISSDIYNGEMDLTNSWNPYSPDSYDIYLKLKKTGTTPVANVAILFTIGDPDGSNPQQLFDRHGNSFWSYQIMNENVLDVVFSGVKLPAGNLEHKRVYAKILNSDFDKSDNKAFVELNDYHADYQLDRDSFHFSNDEITNYIAGRSFAESYSPGLSLTQLYILSKLVRQPFSLTGTFCYGMTTTSFHLWNLKTDVYHMSMEAAFRPIAILHFIQFINSKRNTKMDDKEILNDIKSSLKTANLPIMINVKSESGVYHSVLAYKVVEETNLQNQYQAKVYVYDPNKPFDELELGVSCLLYRNNGFFTQFFEDFFPFPRSYALWKPVRVLAINPAWSAPLIASTKTLWQYLEDELRQQQKTMVAVACPVEPLVTDQYGRRTGIKKGEYFDEVPEAEFLHSDSTKVLILPRENDYQIVTTATEACQFDLFAVNPISESSTEIVSHEHVPLQKSGTATLELLANNPDYTMKIDTDGDGQVDTTRAPDTLTFTGEGLTVWPGDTDNSGMVNQADILPIGLHWGKTGPERTAANKLQWTGQPATPWVPDQNATYADANGDGVVNQGDILVVGLNWGKQHTPSQTVLAEQTTAGRPAGTLHLSIQHDNSNSITLMVESRDFRDVFGLAFELEYPSEQIEIAAVEPGELFGPEALFYKKKDNRKIGIALTQKASHTTAGKSNTIARLTFRIKASATEVAYEDFAIKNISANDPAGSALQLDWQPLTDTESLAEGSLDPPKEYKLFPNYPNPFNPTTTISYALPKASHVQLQIFDLTGQLVKILYNAQQGAGIHSVQWNAKNAQGDKVASGIYILRLSAGELVKHQKLLLVK